MQQGVPNALNIADDLPPSIRGYRRFSTHLNTTQNSFGPGSVALIPLDTGTEGTFVDTRTVRLHFTVTIENHSPYIDFISLGRAGAASFISEIALECNGVPIERNVQYAPTVELEKIRAGEAQDPFLMTFENPWLPAGGAAGHLHCNFIKPSMVDATGKSWHSQMNLTQQFKLAYSRGGMEYNPTVDPAGIGNNTLKADIPFGSGGFSDVDDPCAQPVCGSRVPAMGTPYCGPNHMPCDMEALAKLVAANRAGRNDLKKVMAEGANVKYLPVHHRPTNADWVSDVHFVSWHTTTSPAVCALDNNKGTNTEYHFSLELYMGILGRFNRKWVPTLAIGAGRLQFRLTFQRPQLAFDVSMDPCDRIPGTRRDTAPNTYGRHAFAPHELGHCFLHDRTLAAEQATYYFEEALPSRHANYSSVGAYTKYPILPGTAVALGTFPSIFAFRPLSDASANLVFYDYDMSVGDTFAQSTNPRVPLYVLPSELLPTSYPTIATTNGVVSTDQDPSEPAHSGEPGRGRFAITTPPECQYMLQLTPWLGRILAGGEISATINEGHLCYGTHLLRSRPQSRRTHANALPLHLSTVEMEGMITYQISNLRVQWQEILFSDAITDSLLSAGVAGNAVMETQIIKETRVPLHQASTQKVLIPLTGASIQDICIGFRHNQQLWGVEAWHQPSYSFIDPFSTFTYDKPASTDILKGVDNLRLVTAWGSGDHLGVGIQFKIGGEMIPRKEIDNLHDLSDFVQQGDQIFYGHGELGDYRRLGQFPERMDIFAEWQSIPGTMSKRFSINPLGGGFFTPFVPAILLDDQTVTMNPFLNCYKEQTRKSFLGENILPLYTPPVGTFHISLNLETMMGHGHKTRSGTTIVNNQLYFEATNMHECAKSSLEMFAYARCNAKIVFERGGSMQVVS